MTSSVAGLRSSSKSLPILVVCCSSDPLQLSESKQNHYTWEVCSANQGDAKKTATPEATMGQQKGPSSSPRQYLSALLFLNSTWVHITQPMLQKLNELGYKVLPHVSCSADLLPTDYHLFKHFNNFLQGKCFYNQQERENAFQEFIESWSMDFNIIAINLFLIGKNVSIVTVPILVVKDMF